MDHQDFPRVFALLRCLSCHILLVLGSARHSAAGNSLHPHLIILQVCPCPSSAIRLSEIKTHPRKLSDEITIFVCSLGSPAVAPPGHIVVVAVHVEGAIDGARFATSQVTVSPFGMDARFASSRWCASGSAVLVAKPRSLDWFIKGMRKWEDQDEAQPIAKEERDENAAASSAWIWTIFQGFRFNRMSGAACPRLHAHGCIQSCRVQFAFMSMSSATI